MSQGFDYEKMKNSILSDSTLSDTQKEKLLEDLEKKINGNKKELNVKIEADSGVLRELAQENAELRQKALEKETEIADVLREKLKVKFLEQGVDAPRLETKEDLDNATRILKELQNRKPYEVTGSAPLNDAQLGKVSGSDGSFETREALIDHLRDLEKNGTAEERNYAGKTLNEIFRKWVTAKKNDPNLVDKISESTLETPKEHIERTRKRRGARN